jgi:anti-sigma factor RsiW
MSGNHIPFHTLSDLYDNEIGPGTERDALMHHMASCTECALEYRRLESTVRLCGEYGCATCVREDFPAGAMRSIRSAKRRKMFLKSLPAMAASVLIIAGVGLFNTGIIGVRDGGMTADGGFRKSVSDSERVIDIIRQHNATIAGVTDEYVEGTVPLSSFNELRKRLGSRRVAYLLVDGSSPAPAVQWNNAIEEVGLTDGQGAAMPEPGSSKKFVVFRVFR